MNDQEKTYVTNDNVKNVNTLHERTIITVDGRKYLMVDVAGDGNCFYSSLLKNKYFHKRFKTVKRIRNSLRRWVMKWYRKDCLMRQLFQVDNTNIKTWAETIGQTGTWATSLEMMLLTYCTGVQITIIGNYINGFVKIETSEQIRELTGVTNILKEKREPIMLYLHQQGLADVPTQNPNHFSYLRYMRSGSDNVEENSPVVLNNKREKTMKDDDSKLGMVVKVEKPLLSGSFLSSDDDSEENKSESYMSDRSNNIKSKDDMTKCEKERLMENIEEPTIAYDPHHTTFQDFKEMFGFKDSDNSDVDKLSDSGSKSSWLS